jgi:glutamate dehydrogenase/leucine dehydrogenase
VGRAVNGPDNNTDEQALDFVAGQRDQVARCGAACVFVGADDDDQRP